MSDPEAAALRADRESQLAGVLRDEVPLAGGMGVEVVEVSARGLTLAMPLAPNRNPHQTAFAGSLNALCTLAGWAATHALLDDLGLAGATVIRRSSIKYHEPVRSERIEAICLPMPETDQAHFGEMLAAKGQAKLDHVVQIAGTEPDRAAVLFAGSYVVTARSSARE